jgi:hypothetical protein
MTTMNDKDELTIEFQDVFLDILYDGHNHEDDYETAYPLLQSHLARARKLIEQGADINASFEHNEESLPALSHVIYGMNYESVYGGDYFYEVVYFLLEMNADFEMEMFSHKDDKLLEDYLQRLNRNVIFSETWDVSRLETILGFEKVDLSNIIAYNIRGRLYKFVLPIEYMIAKASVSIRDIRRRENYKEKIKILHRYGSPVPSFKLLTEMIDAESTPQTIDKNISSFMEIFGWYLSL